MTYAPNNRPTIFDYAVLIVACLILLYGCMQLGRLILGAHHHG